MRDYRSPQALVYQALKNIGLRAHAHAQGTDPQFHHVRQAGSGAAAGTQVDVTIRDYLANLLKQEYEPNVGFLGGGSDDYEPQDYWQYAEQVMDRAWHAVESSEPFHDNSYLDETAGDEVLNHIINELFSSGRSHVFDLSNLEELVGSQRVDFFDHPFEQGLEAPQEMLEAQMDAQLPEPQHYSDVPNEREPTDPYAPAIDEPATPAAENLAEVFQAVVQDEALAAEHNAAEFQLGLESIVEAMDPSAADTHAADSEPMMEQAHEPAEWAGPEPSEPPPGHSLEDAVEDELAQQMAMLGFHTGQLAPFGGMGHGAMGPPM